MIKIKNGRVSGTHSNFEQEVGIFDMKDKVQHIFLVGAKSLGAYGGYETFVNKLTEYHQDNNPKCHHYNEE